LLTKGNTGNKRQCGAKPIARTSGKKRHIGWTGRPDLRDRKHQKAKHPDIHQCDPRVTAQATVELVMRE
jgi:hypothetical protein